MPSRRERSRAKAGRAAISASRAAYLVSPLRQALVWLVAARTAAVVLAMDPGSLHVFDVSKVAVGRAIALVMLGILIAYVLKFGTRVIPRSPILLGVAAIVAANAISLLFAQDRYVGLFGEADSYLGVTFILDCAILTLAASAAYRTTADVRVLAIALGSVFAVTLAYGVAQRFGLDPLGWVDEYQTRPVSTLGNANIFAHFLSVSFGIALAVALFPPPGDRRALVRGLALAVALAAAVMVVFGGARGALLGLAAATLAVLVLLIATGTTLQASRRTVIAAVILTAAALVVLPATPLGERIAQTAAGRALQDRALIYDSAVQAFVDRPVVGHGPDSFGVIYPTYRQPRSAEVLGEISEVSAHSWFLNTAATLGIAGLAATVLAIGIAIWLMRLALFASPWLMGPIAAGFVAYWANGLVSIGAVAIDWMPWLAFGLIAAWTGPAVTPQQRGVPPVMTWGVIALCLVAAGFSANLVLAQRDLSSARAAYLSGDADASLGSARSAVERDPGRADGWNWLGLAHTDAQRWREAGDAFEQAAHRAPHRVNYWTNLATARSLQASEGDESRGGHDAAIAAATRAAEVDPNDPEGHGALAQVLSSAGRHEPAVLAARRALELSRVGGAAESIVLEVAERTSDRGAARSLFEMVLARHEVAAARAGLAKLAAADGDHTSAMDQARRAIEAGLDLQRQTEMRLVVVDALMKGGDRSAARQEIDRAVAADPSSVAARRVQIDLERHAPATFVVQENFSAVPPWTAEGGRSIGSAASGILTATELPWRVLVEPSMAADVRVSVQFRFTGPPTGSAPFIVGRWVDEQNAIFVAQHGPPAHQTRLVMRLDGVDTLIVAGDHLDMRVGNWYWLELELIGQEVRVRTFESGSAPRPKSDATPRGRTLAGTIDPRLRVGRIFLGSDLVPPVQIGGVMGAPGGFTVEELR